MVRSCFSLVFSTLESLIFSLSTDNTTIYFLKDLLCGKKNHILNADVQTLYVPQYKNLTLEHIMEFVSSQGGLADYLPDEPDLPKIPKQWVVNVCTAVIGDAFRDWVAQQIEERNALMAEKREFMIAMDPQLAAKFQASTHVSRKSEQHPSTG